MQSSLALISHLTEEMMKVLREHNWKQFSSLMEQRKIFLTLFAAERQSRKEEGVVNELYEELQKVKVLDRELLQMLRQEKRLATREAGMAAKSGRVCKAYLAA